MTCRLSVSIFSSSLFRSFHLLALAILLALIAGDAIAQVTSPIPDLSIGQTFNGETATPLPGGHDYIHLFSETVNPSNGSLAFNIQLPIPKGRGLTLPFTLTYNSAGVYHLGTNFTGQLGFVPTDLKGDSLPWASWSESSFTPFSPTGVCGSQCPTYSQCNVANGFTFNDPSGTSHSLTQLGIAATSSVVPPPPQNPQPCSVAGPGLAIPTVGGSTDGKVWATFTSPGQAPASLSAVAVQNWNVQPGFNQQVNGSIGAFTVTDESGTTYFFDGNGVYDANNQVNWENPYKIEDRNGNEITYPSGIPTDTLGRTIINSVSGGLSIGGLVYPTPTCTGSCPISTSVNYSVPNNPQWVGTLTNGDDGVSCPTQTDIMTVTSSQPAWSGLALPTSTISNPQQYTSYYGTFIRGGTTNSFGLLNEVTYPDGGWVKYTWKLSNDASVLISGNGYSQMGAFQGQGKKAGSFSGTVYAGGCLLFYATPVLASRTVSFDGVNIAQTQTFKYQTTWGTGGTSGWDWTAKQTYVTTTDNTPGGASYLTVYNYLPTGTGVTQFSYGSVASQIPLESSTVYHSTTSPTGPVLRTVTKLWADMFNLSEEDTTENGLTSKVTYGYTSFSTASPFTVLASKWEYDFGASSPTRKTAITYQTFPAGPFGPVPAQPSTVIVSNSSAAVAETDYAYDVYGAGISSVSAIQHDTNYGTAFTNRGNITSMTRVCTGCTNAVTTYMYDLTGYPASMTDPNLNTTTYSFTDSPSGGNSAGNSNAYLTQVTYPQTGTTVHQEGFQYNYAFGDLTQSADENTPAQVTTYQYADPFDRLTQSAFPDGGLTNVVYTDSPTAPSVATCQLINGAVGETCSGTTPPTGWKTSVALMDGMFHTKQTQLASDPTGIDFVDTTFDGLARTRTVSNPHRTAAASTDGTATTAYDVLGRPITVTEQDGSIVQTAYDQTCKTLTSTLGTTVTDEASHVRRTCTDGLGRLVEVDEPSSTGLTTPLVTLYTYDALGNLLCVVQKGTDTTAFTTCAAASLTWRPRSFTYDSLSRLTTAHNPESGTISYAYDANSNVVSKTAPSPNQIPSGTKTVVTTYTYDALNRLTLKSYADSYTSNAVTPPVKYGYDGVTLTGCTKAPPTLPDTYPIGRRTSMCDGSGATSWDHDPKGRTVQDKRFIGAVSVAKFVNYGYNPDGSVHNLTTPTLNTITYSYSGAGRATQVVDTADSLNFATNAAYAPPGELTNLLRGGTIHGAFTYNSRLQPLQMFYGTNTPGVLTGTTCPGTVGNIMHRLYNFTFSTADNGNVTSISNCRDTSRTESFTYDGLNRILSAQSNGSQWGENFGIDNWGNLTQETAISGKTNHEGLNTTAGTNNQQLWL